MALRRRGGVDGVDFDTRGGLATGFFTSPAVIDVVEIDGACDDAGYKTVSMTIEISGRTLSAPCATCGGDVTWLEVSETGQRFELVGDVEPGQTLRVSGAVTNWTGEHVRLDVD
jgi:hypothetical protein